MKRTFGFHLLAGACALALVVARSARALEVPAQREGGEEITIGSGGTIDARDAFGGLNFAYAWFAAPVDALLVRQSIDTSKRSGERGWHGSTRFAYDRYLRRDGVVRPFVGANFGGSYGDDTTRHGFAAGFEAGAKFYVHPRVFLYGVADYGWQFTRFQDIGDRFSHGHVNWSAGVGYSF